MDIYKPQFMMRMVEQMPPCHTFLKDTFFRRVQRVPTESVMFDIVKRGRPMAPFVTELGETVLERDGYRTVEFTPPLVAPSRPLTGDDLKVRLPGEAVFSGSSTNKRRAEILQNDLIELDEAITRREEWLAAQTLFQGSVIMRGKGVDKRIDYDFENMKVVEEPWSDTKKSDPMRDLRRARKLAAQSGYSPNMMIADSDTVDYLIDNERVQKHLDNSGMRIGLIEPRFLESGAQYHGFLRQSGLHIYSYDGEFVDNENENPDYPGVQPGDAGFIPKVYTLLPRGRVFVGSNRIPTRMLYGAVNHIVRIGDQQKSRVPHSWYNDKGTVRFLEMCSRPLPCPLNVSAWVLLDVLEED